MLIPQFSLILLALTLTWTIQVSVAPDMGSCPILAFVFFIPPAGEQGMGYPGWGLQTRHTCWTAFALRTQQSVLLIGPWTRIHHVFIIQHWGQNKVQVLPRCEFTHISKEVCAVLVVWLDGYNLGLLQLRTTEVASGKINIYIKIHQQR